MTNCSSKRKQECLLSADCEWIVGKGCKSVGASRKSASKSRKSVSRKSASKSRKSVSRKSASKSRKSVSRKSASKSRKSASKSRKSASRKSRVKHSSDMGLMELFRSSPSPSLTRSELEDLVALLRIQLEEAEKRAIVAEEKYKELKHATRKLSYTEQEKYDKAVHNAFEQVGKTMARYDEDEILNTFIDLWKKYEPSKVEKLVVLSLRSYDAFIESEGLSYVENIEMLDMRGMLNEGILEESEKLLSR